MEQENTSKSITTCSTQVIAIGNGASNIVDDALRQQPNDNNDFHFDNVLRRQLYDNIDSRFDEAPKQQPYNVDFLFVNDEQENTDEEMFKYQGEKGQSTYGAHRCTRKDDS